MESRTVVTYKRKRLFSRTDHSETPSEVSGSKTVPNNVNKSEELIADPNLPKKEENELAIRHGDLEVKDGDNLVQCGNCGSQDSSQCSERATKRQKLCSDCSNQKDLSDSQKITINRKVHLEGSQARAEEISTEVSPLVKSGSEYEDRPDETFSDKVHTDKNSSPRNNLKTSRPNLGSTLITFCRRSKRNKEIAAANCSVDATNENIVANNPVIGSEEKDTREKTPSLEGKVCMDVPENSNVNPVNVESQSLPNEDLTPPKMPNDVSEKQSSPSSHDMSITPPAVRDIDCNLPLDCGSDEDHQSGPSELVDTSLGSTSKVKDSIPTSPLQTEYGYPVGAVADKGKAPLDPLPVPMDTSNNNYLQLLPENRTHHHAPWLANSPQIRSQLHLSSGQSSQFHGLSLQPDPMVNNTHHHPSYPSSYAWPQSNLQSRETIQDFRHSTLQPLPTHKMMLDTLLSRGRAARGNAARYLNPIEPLPVTWLEEELDCLWIGVRRHGKGNWDAMLRDKRLNFLPWKTPQDLAERWQEEQNKLIYGPPVSSQVKYNQIPSEFMNIHSNRLHLQKPVSTHSRPVVSPHESSSNLGPMKGSLLPHWLREAIETPPPVQRCTSQSLVSPAYHPGYSHQPFMNNRGVDIRRRKTKPHNSGRVINQEDVIVITSDASSEETISDDHS